MSSKVEWKKPIVVVSFTLEDVVQAGFTRWEAASLTEKELQLICADMADSFTDDLRRDIELAVSYVLNQRMLPEERKLNTAR